MSLFELLSRPHKIWNPNNVKINTEPQNEFSLMHKILSYREFVSRTENYQKAFTETETQTELQLQAVPMARANPLV